MEDFFYLLDKIKNGGEKEEDYETCLDIAQMKTVHKPKKYIDAIYNNNRKVSKSISDLQTFECNKQ